MKLKEKKKGFTLIELLVTLTIIGVFLVVLFQIILVESRITEKSEAMICIQDEERYVAEFLFEILYGVERIEFSGDQDPLPISSFCFIYDQNSCPLLGSIGEKNIRFVQEGSLLQIWDERNGYPMIKKTIAYHVTDASCEFIRNDNQSGTPLLHVFLTFEAGHASKSYDLLFAMRNLS